MHERAFPIKRQTSARQSVTLVVLLVLAGLDSPSFAQHSRVELRAPKGKEVAYSLTVVTPREASFDELLGKNFPGASSLPNFRSIHPYLVLLRNDAPLPVIAYSLRWKLSYQDGRTETISRTAMVRPLSEVQNVTLVPGTVRLVSPTFNVTPRAWNGTSNFAERASLDLLPTSTGLVSSAAELDGVVYADNSYSGPRGPEVWRRYAATRLAAHDAAVYVLGLINSSTSLSSLYSRLDLQLQRGFAQNGTSTMDLYVHARGQIANDVTLLLLRDGVENALAVLRRTAGGAWSPRAVSLLGEEYDRLFASLALSGHADGAK